MSFQKDRHNSEFNININDVMTDSMTNETVSSQNMFPKMLKDNIQVENQDSYRDQEDVSQMKSKFLQKHPNDSILAKTQTTRNEYERPSV